jgi:hypothetical protein
MEPTFSVIVTIEHWRGDVAEKQGKLVHIFSGNRQPIQCQFNVPSLHFKYHVLPMLLVGSLIVPRLSRRRPWLFHSVHV